MKPYVATLCIHVIAALALVAAVSLEAFLLRGVIRASAQSDAAPDLELFPHARLTASLSLLLLLLSGGYLTASASLWSLAWPKIAVAIVLLFGALSGLSGRQMKQFREREKGPEITAQSRRSLSSRIVFLKASLGIRCGLVLAAVLLMSAQPTLMASVGIVSGLSFIGWGVAALPFGSSVNRTAPSGSQWQQPSR